ncbi:MAG: ABC transporter permease [Puniceicoccales bacterium]|jgi:hypothetical protein|nr:ABC transporter permease [Puniceicoccales bacterium]
MFSEARILFEELSDFPEWLSAVLVKELRQGLRTRFFQIGFMVLHLLLLCWSVAFLWEYIFDYHGGYPLESFFWVGTGCALTVFAARGFWAISGERRKNTFELLLLSGLTPWQIIAGKWSSLMAQSVLLLTSLVPYGVLRYYSGSFDLLRDVRVALTMLSFTALAIAIAVLLSQCSRLVLILIACSLFFGPGGMAAGILFLIFSVFSGTGTFIFLLIFFPAVFTFLTVNFAAVILGEDFHSCKKRMLATGVLLALAPVLCALFGEPFTSCLAAFGISVPGLALLVIYWLASASSKRTQMPNKSPLGIPKS